MAGLLNTKTTMLAVILGLIIVASIALKPRTSMEDDTQTQEPAVEVPTIENTTINEPQDVVPGFIIARSITLSQTLTVPGEMIEIHAIIARVGEVDDPANVELYVSGEHAETVKVVFGESEEAEVVFTTKRYTQGFYYTTVLNATSTFEVRFAAFEVENVDITPHDNLPGYPYTLSFTARNPNGVEDTQRINIYVEPMFLDIEVTIPPYGEQQVYHEFTREWPADYEIRVGEWEIGFTVLPPETPVEDNGGDEDWEPSTVERHPMFYHPDPLTYNFTSILPPEASPVRLSLGVEIESLFGYRWSGIGGFGLHAGGHKEGLDHVWIEYSGVEPVKSWGNGTITGIDWVGDEEHGEYHIGIDFGQGLKGSYMEVETPLVEVGDYVEKGQPVAIGVQFFPNLKSAEFSLIDENRADGVSTGGDGVFVSPFDYLVESDKIALAEAYIENVVDPYMEGKSVIEEFHPDQPYFTNRLLLHDGNDGKLTGEWYLISENWTVGYPNDFITFIEVVNPYFTGNVVYGEDHHTGGRDTWNLNGEFTVDYELCRIKMNTKEGTYYGLFEINESSERATLKLEYRKSGYPSEFTSSALIYIERDNLSRGLDAYLLGVTDGW
ncbi:MAG: M23 family metallopeptidase [Candidatus Bathyarchaeota archaeon]|nr:M23 family metallopeptidase [Candidatus Bathyarchaeota archaeon]